MEKRIKRENTKKQQIIESKKKNQNSKSLKLKDG